MVTYSLPPKPRQTLSGLVPTLRTFASAAPAQTASPRPAAKKNALVLFMGREMVTRRVLPVNVKPTLIHGQGYRMLK